MKSNFRVLLGFIRGIVSFILLWREAVYYLILINLKGLFLLVLVITIFLFIVSFVGVFGIEDLSFWMTILYYTCM